MVIGVDGEIVGELNKAGGKEVPLKSTLVTSDWTFPREEVRCHSVGHMWSLRFPGGSRVSTRDSLSHRRDEVFSLSLQGLYGHTPKASN